MNQKLLEPDPASQKLPKLQCFLVHSLACICTGAVTDTVFHLAVWIAAIRKTINLQLYTQLNLC